MNETHSGTIGQLSGALFHRTGEGRSSLSPARAIASALALLAVAFVLMSCGEKPSVLPGTAADPHLQTNGTFEVAARLVEIPEGAIFKRDLYDYATVLKYEVLKVHRGDLKAHTIYVGQYNPFKPRSEAADGRVKQIGGNLKEFRTGQVHHMALDAPIEDHFMGGIVNKYFGQATEPIYWAVWTNLE